MKIEIEFESSHEATVTIDDVKLEYGYQNGVWSYHTYPKKLAPFDRRLGGLIANKLSSPLIDILQAWMPDAMPDRAPEAWELLPKRVAEEVEDKLDG